MHRNFFAVLFRLDGVFCFRVGFFPLCMCLTYSYLSYVRHDHVFWSFLGRVRQYCQDQHFYLDKVCLCFLY